MPIDAPVVRNFSTTARVVPRSGATAETALHRRRDAGATLALRFQCLQGWIDFSIGGVRLLHG